MQSKTKSNLQNAIGSTVRELVREYLAKFPKSQQHNLAERAERKSKKTYSMSLAQRRVYERIQAVGGSISRLEYLAEDWRVTNPMFSRGWLVWRTSYGLGSGVISGPRVEVGTGFNHNKERR
jgi:hypothetical protein